MSSRKIFALAMMFLVSAVISVAVAAYPVTYAPMLDAPLTHALAVVAVLFLTGVALCDHLPTLLSGGPRIADAGGVNEFLALLAMGLLYVTAPQPALVATARPLLAALALATTLLIAVFARRTLRAGEVE